MDSGVHPPPDHRRPLSSYPIIPGKRPPVDLAYWFGDSSRQRIRLNSGWSFRLRSSTSPFGCRLSCSRRRWVHWGDLGERISKELSDPDKQKPQNWYMYYIPRLPWPNVVAGNSDQCLAAQSETSKRVRQDRTYQRSTKETPGQPQDATRRQMRTGQPPTSQLLSSLSPV